MSVQTVMGPVQVAKLGHTLPHEHLSMEFSHFYRSPPLFAAAALAAEPSLETVGLLRQYPYSSKFNLRLDDEKARKAVIADLKAFKSAGGGCIVENSSTGIGRDLAFMQRASRETGVHVVAGTGHYIADVQTPGTRELTVEAIYTLMKRELTEGCEDAPSIRAGFMGEIASVWPIQEMERHAIVAAGMVQAETGHAVSFHPHRVAAAPAHIVRLYLEAGGRADKALMSHVDRTLRTKEQVLEFAELGCYVGFDLFGTECSEYQLAPEVDMPSDAERLSLVAAMVEDGRARRVAVSHDIHTKHRLQAFGGHGYRHIITNIAPRMRRRGISEEDVRAILYDNPQQWLAV